MPSNYNFTQNGVSYSFDDVFVPGKYFRKTADEVDRLLTWGRNTNSSGYGGQLGTNDITNRLTPVLTFTGGVGWKEISANRTHSAAIKTDGSLWVWGRNYNGQLGTNNTTTRSTPVTTFAGGTNWSKVSCGYEFTMAIKTDGSLWVWGSNGSGQLGINTTTSRSTPVTTFAGGTNWSKISSGSFHSTSIKTDGSLWVWGYNDDRGLLGINNGTNNSFRVTPVTTFAGGTNWSQVSAGVWHTLAVKTDGTLWAWGENYSLQLGNNSDSPSVITPVTTFAGGTNWSSASAGGSHSAAIKTDGSLWVWGSNGGSYGNDSNRGILGTNDGKISESITPVTTFAGGNDWKEIYCGLYHTLAVKTDGSLWTWGRNTYGQLGTNDTITRSVPVNTFTNRGNWKKVSANNHSMGIKYFNTADPII